MIYLMCPYTSHDPSVRELRFELACQAAAQLMKEGEVVFSPITHGHHIVPYLPDALAHDHRFWMEQCLPILLKCDWVYLLPLWGWTASQGIRVELETARQAGIPIKEYRPTELQSEIYSLTSLRQGLSHAT